MSFQQLTVGDQSSLCTQAVGERICFLVLFSMAPFPMALYSANLKKMLPKPSYISTHVPQPIISLSSGA